MSQIIDATREWAARSVNGLILCSAKDESLVRYALDGLPNNVMAGGYRITVPDESLLAGELDRTRQVMELRGSITPEASALSGPLSEHDQEDWTGAPQ